MIARFYEIFGPDYEQQITDKLEAIHERWKNEKSCYMCKHDKDISDNWNTCHLCEYTNNFLPEELTCLLWELKEEE